MLADDLRNERKCVFIITPCQLRNPEVISYEPVLVWKAELLWWFFLFYVLVFKFFVLLAPYVCFHIFN